MSANFVGGSPELVRVTPLCVHLNQQRQLRSFVALTMSLALPRANTSSMRAKYCTMPAYLRRSFARQKNVVCAIVCEGHAIEYAKFAKGF
jgi:hypothetical protein